MFLVVLGSSLGGLRAVQTVLAGLPAGFPAAVLIVQHRERDAGEALTDLLQGKSAMPVVEAEDKMPVEPGRVYLAPPDYHLLVEPGQCALSVDAPVNYARPSIDVLFESAAEAYRDRVAGVLLTGANADGAAGMAAIKEAGGLTLAQDPATAESPAMPAAAIALGAVERVLALELIAPALIEACETR